MPNKCLCCIIVSAFTICLLGANSAQAVKSPIAGDPELIWVSPLGDDNIENNAYNRCRLIRLLKPGVDEATASQDNFYDTMSTYATNLFAQSIKIAAYIEKEKEKPDNSVLPDLSNEGALIENEITNRLIGISRRINIINSFEAGTAMLNNMQQIIARPANSYQEFKAMVDGKYVFATECEALK